MNPTPPPDASAATVYRRLLSYARPHRGMFMIGVFGMLLFAATDGAFVFFVQKFVKGMTDLQYSSLTSANPAIFWLIPIGAPVLFLLRGIGDYMSTYFPGYVGRQVIKSIRADLFRQYLHLPASYYDRVPGGTLLSKLTYNIEQVAEATTKSITSIIRDSVTIVVLIGLMFYNSWQLGALVFLIAPPLSWLVRKVSSSFRRYSARIQASMGDVTRIVKEALDGQRVIKVFNAQEQEAADFEKVNEHNRRSNMKLIAARATSNPVVQFIASLALGAILWVAMRQIAKGTLALDTFMGFLTALLMTTAAAQAAHGFFRAARTGRCRRRQRVRSARHAFRRFQIGPRAGARGRRRRLSRREFRVRRGEGHGAEFGFAQGRGRQDGGHCRPLWQRQVHARGVGAAHSTTLTAVRFWSTASTCTTATFATCVRTCRS